MNNYDLLLQKLDAFTRKYYSNQLLRGSLIFSACIIIYLLLITVGEYFFFFSAPVKLTILGILGSAGFIALVKWIVIPLLKLKKMGNIISHEQAATIIGKHFPEISDKLLNVLQLKQQNSHTASMNLIEASIQQKSEQLTLLPFSQAINLNKNKKYLPFVLAPIAIALIIFFFSPNVFSDASSRLLQPTQNFTPPAPFAFHITNEQMEIPMYSNYTLKASVKGEKLPEKVYVTVGNEHLEMKRITPNSYEYTFQRVAAPIQFKLTALAVESPAYELKIIEKPLLQSFKVTLSYPSYTGKKSETLESLSDISVPVGTVFNWSIQAKHTESVGLKLGKQGSIQPLQSSNNQWTGNARFLSDSSYTLYLSNKQMPLSDSFQYQVQVIEDLSPQIQMVVIKDSIAGQQILMNGNASDDYGIRTIAFHYSITDAQKNVITQKTIPLKTTTGSVVPFQHYFDIGALQLLPGQEVTYYTECWDNDAVHGSKSARSDVHTYRMYNLEQVDSAMQQNAQQINQGLSSSADQAKKIQQDLKEVQNQLLQSESVSWEKQQNLNSLVDRQEQLKNQVEAIKKRFNEQRKQSEKKNYSEEIKEKQEAISKQLDNLLQKELAEQLKKLQEMMQSKNKDKVFEDLKQVEQQNKLFNMDMARIQELMRKLDMQMKMEDLAKKMQALAQKEMDLQEKTMQPNSDKNNLTEEQKQIQKELQQTLSNDLKDIEKLNAQQQQPEKLDDAQEAAKEADKEMSNSKDELQQGDRSAAKQAQQKAAQQLNKMAAALQKAASGMDADQIDIDIKATRQLLTNLIRFSFDQEKLMKSVKATSPNSPNYVPNVQEQSRLRTNARQIKDSLYSLSKRVFQIAPTINKETSDLEKHLNTSITALENRNITEGFLRQQYAMTSANNLALLLNELLENLMQNQAQAQSGSGSSSSSGKGKSKGGKNGSGGSGQMMKDIISGQQELGEGLGKGRQGNSPGSGNQGGGKGQGSSGSDKKGGNKGDNNNGSSGDSGGEGDGEGNNSEQIARMAQQQAALRRQIQELSSMLNSKGMSGNAKELKAIQDAMDKNETDLVNRKLNIDLIRRQKDIMSRLLEAEKSIRDQEEDNKRTANAGKEEQRPMPPELQQYIKSQQSILDAYKTTPPALKPYYKKMAENYLKQIKQ